ncbi:[SSU ribosomal protein S5P]-alanine acetyltransferase [Tistlia consotensis]|uniref:[SSU ribosomal protein S5P]-alanine acetyltransferase n=1 Tax=Tistlia consotensis USBA 355 TaxID=560819 RepID=A0A1Y6BBD1_9PROT|nr:GNAT family protein [Tistlia consotensis]SME94579.1 [SSU ribosomal protein S5P]-alanine acetyltransferase [Tistlia consotensis USBA 355]SNR29430.1 [SSU ribosomal protein S5P]-alanine acetyltransferase [Tistlia consotensis]
MRSGPLVRGLPRLWSAALGPRLNAARVYLRPPTIDDWRAWSELRRESRGFLTPWEPTWPADALTVPAFRRRIRQYARERQARSGFSFLIFRRAEAAGPGEPRGADALVGGASLTNVRRGVSQSASLGYWIGRRYARQGYMHEALVELLDWSFGPLGLHRVEAACLPGNRPSRGLLEKLGFTEEGLARGYLMIDGRWQDHVLYGLVDADWKARRD